MGTLSIEGKVEVRCDVERAWALFNRFGDVAALIPTVEDVEVDGDTVHARVETRLGALPVSSRVMLQVIERKDRACLKARGVSYLGETLTEQMKKNVEGVAGDSVGNMLLHLDLRPGETSDHVAVIYTAEVEAKGRLKRIYKAILSTKVPALMEEFADNIRRELEREERPEEGSGRKMLALSEPVPQATSEANGGRPTNPAPAGDAAALAVVEPAPASWWARLSGWLHGWMRRLREVFG